MPKNDESETGGAIFFLIVAAAFAVWFGVTKVMNYFEPQKDAEYDIRIEAAETEPELRNFLRKLPSDDAGRRARERGKIKILQMRSITLEVDQEGSGDSVTNAVTNYLVDSILRNIHIDIQIRASAIGMGYSIPGGAPKRCYYLKSLSS